LGAIAGEIAPAPYPLLEPIDQTPFASNAYELARPAVLRGTAYAVASTFNRGAACFVALSGALSSRTAFYSFAMNLLIKEIRHNPLLWLLVAVPVLFAAHRFEPGAHTLLFALSVFAIVPLAALLSHATESVAAKTGDAVGGLLNATLGNLTELVIALTALRAGQYMLVKASIAGVIVTNTLFMLGASFLLGGLKYRTQEYNQINARFQAGLLFLATIALLIPSAISQVDSAPAATFTHQLSVGLSVLLMVAYGLGLVFSLKTHREQFSSADAGAHEGTPWPMSLALPTLAVVTVLVALTSEVFVESVQHAATELGMSQAFVGFIVVALVGGAAEMASAFSGARKNRLDLSVGIALGSASQIALFVAPVMVLMSYFIGPAPMDLIFWPGAVVMMLLATLTASLVTNTGRSAWFTGALVLMVYVIFAMTLYLLPPRPQ
jgi:Ca2+:H+ antiporter